MATSSVRSSQLWAPNFLAWKKQVSGSYPRQNRISIFTSGGPREPLPQEPEVQRKAAQPSELSGTQSSPAWTGHLPFGCSDLTTERLPWLDASYVRPTPWRWTLCFSSSSPPPHRWEVFSPEKTEAVVSSARPGMESGWCVPGELPLHSSLR